MPEPIQSMCPAPAYTPAEEPLLPSQSQGPITTMALVDGTASLSELAVDCAAKADQAVLAAAGATANPLLIGLASLKAGWELGECIDKHLHDADVKATLIECTKKGGTPVGILEHSVSCQGVKP